MPATRGDETLNTFRFFPKADVGVNSSCITPECNELNCFSAIVTDNVLELLVETTNEYATSRCAKNTPAKQYSRYLNWVKTNITELYKFIAVLIMMGIDPRPNIRDYWATHEGLYTPWYTLTFARDRFLTIYQSMIHAGEADSTGKAKIEPFINDLMKKSQVYAITKCFN
jgi:Transposase IS4